MLIIEAFPYNNAYNFIKINIESINIEYPFINKNDIFTRN